MAVKKRLRKGGRYSDFQSRLQALKKRTRPVDPMAAMTPTQSSSGSPIIVKPIGTTIVIVPTTAPTIIKENITSIVSNRFCGFSFQSLPTGDGGCDQKRAQSVKKWQEGASVESIFNASRPKYPIISAETLLARKRKLKDFTIDHLEKYEIAAIKNWTRDSTPIKQYMWGVDENLEAAGMASILFGLFERYQKNVATGERLYRGMAVPDDLYYGLGYDDLTKGDLYSPDELAIASFSKSKRVAYEYARDGEAINKVILRVVVREEDPVLHIEEFSEAKEEAEVLLNKNVWYTVKQTKAIKVGGIRWKLIILE